MREFNTSGPNIPKQHYTITRKNLIEKGIQLVNKSRYFTIRAPRQTGKITYFRQLAQKLEEIAYKVAYINFENFKPEKIQTFIRSFKRNVNEFWNTEYDFETIPEFFELMQTQKKGKNVLIIDEVEGINPEYFGTFLHSVRNAYHSRENHCLKSVILVRVSNIVGVVSDNASCSETEIPNSFRNPFNIADNLNVPYFTNKEVFELIKQHETETGQLFEEKVKNKICQITANQPGLVNGFAKKLADDNLEKKEITYDDYLKVESWYLNEAIDKNFSNILNKAREYRSFVETLLFTENKIPFNIDRPSIKLLHTNGLIEDDGHGFLTFWVPFYKKRLYVAFYPYSNGEQTDILRSFAVSELFDKNNKLIFDKLILGYKEYVKRRGFNVFRYRDEENNYTSIKESALIYSFETYIQAFLQVVSGKSYREADTGLGKSDLIINVNSEEYIIESKIYYYETQFLTGKKQLAYYCQSLGLDKGIYLVFCPTGIKYPKTVTEQKENINKVEIITYSISYDESKW